MMTTVLARVCRGEGTREEGEKVAEAFDQVWAWAVSHRIVEHARYGDTIASRIVGLVDAVATIQ